MQEETKNIFKSKVGTSHQQVNIYRGEVGKHCLTQESIAGEKEKKTKENYDYEEEVKHKAD